MHKVEQQRQLFALRYRIAEWAFTRLNTARELKFSPDDSEGYLVTFFIVTLSKQLRNVLAQIIHSFMSKFCVSRLSLSTGSNVLKKTSKRKFVIFQHINKIRAFSATHTPGQTRYSDLLIIWRSSKCATAECSLRRTEWSEHPGDLETAAFRQSSRGRAGVQAAVRGGERSRHGHANRPRDENQSCPQHGTARAHPVHKLHGAGVGLHPGRRGCHEQFRVLHHRGNW